MRGWGGRGGREKEGKGGGTFGSRFKTRDSKLLANFFNKQDKCWEDIMSLLFSCSFEIRTVIVTRMVLVHRIGNSGGYKGAPPPP